MSEEDSRGYLWTSLFFLAICLGIWFYILKEDECPSWLFWTWTASYAICCWNEALYFFSYPGDLYSDTFRSEVLCVLVIPYIILHYMMCFSILSNAINRYSPSSEIHAKLGVVGIFIFCILLAFPQIFNDTFAYGTMTLSLILAGLLFINLLWAAYDDQNIMTIIGLLPVMLVMLIAYMPLIWLCVNNFWALLVLFLIYSLTYKLMGGYEASSIPTTCGYCHQFNDKAVGTHTPNAGFCTYHNHWRNRYDPMCSYIQEKTKRRIMQRNMEDWEEHQKHPRLGDNMQNMLKDAWKILFDCMERVSNAC